MLAAATTKTKIIYGLLFSVVVVLFFPPAKIVRAVAISNILYAYKYVFGERSVTIDGVTVSMHNGWMLDGRSPQRIDALKVGFYSGEFRLLLGSVRVMTEDQMDRIISKISIYFTGSCTKTGFPIYSSENEPSTFGNGTVEIAVLYDMNTVIYLDANMTYEDGGTMPSVYERKYLEELSDIVRIDNQYRDKNRSTSRLHKSVSCPVVEK